MTIEIREYNPHWKAAFEDERKSLLKTFHDNIQAIEHIGSTSIPGLSAKPVVDIFIAVLPFHSMYFYEKLFDSRYYRYTPTGMDDRYLFSKYNQDKVWTHNLHILPFNENFYLRNEILFRDYLVKKPELVLTYNDLKRQLAEKNYNSLEEYTQEKTQFIQTVVDLARTEKRLPRQNVWTMEYT